MQYIVIIVFLALATSIIETIIKNKNKRLQIQHSILKDEIKLEELKQKNYILETEKLRLELKQAQESFSTKDKLLNFKPIEPDADIEPNTVEFK